MKFFFTTLTLFVFLLNGQLAFSDAPSKPELSADQLSFDYLSSMDGFWYDCVTTKDLEPHDFIVQCESTKFRVHLILDSYFAAPNGTTFELHFWADRLDLNPQSATQSTWLTVDDASQLRRLIGYVGFDNDATQLRVQINF